MGIENNKKKYRSNLFLYIDGIALIPAISFLKKYNILDQLDKETTDINDLNKQISSDSGYLAVLLRMLASQGYINFSNGKYNKRYIKKNSRTKELISISNIIKKFDINEIIEHSINLDNLLFNQKIDTGLQTYKKLFKTYTEILNTNYSNNNKYIKRALMNIEGFIIGPIMVAMTINNYWDKETRFIDPQGFNGNKSLFSEIVSFLITINFLTKSDNKHLFTEKGIFFLKRSTAFGVTVSYLRTFRMIRELVLGNPEKIWNRENGGLETHVDRYMNVWGSGGAHSIYFKKIDYIVKNIFNQPIEKQPIGLADMGCGDGTFLIHLYNLITQNTNRGKYLNSHPLFIIGADFNLAARDTSKKNLTKNGIDHFIIDADISQPEKYANDLNKITGHKLEDYLNIRSFIDHNRVYSIPKEISFPHCSSSGTFNYRGRLIPNDEIMQNLIEHFKTWQPYIYKHGLLVLELHTIKPIIASKNIGKTLATAYDATHGLSDQYIIEHDIFISAASYSNLVPVKEYQTLYPNQDMVTVSINLLKKQ